MKNIGKYNGIPCYECSDYEYTNVVKSGQDNGKQIFIIDGTMVKKNEIIGYYDGKHVRDVYDGVPYKVNHVPGPQVSMDREEPKVEPEVSVPTGTAEIKEIVYSDYTKVVDAFFAHLSDPVI